MTLSAIKFNYQDKIDNINARIGRYQEIIGDYNVRIKRAEKEDNPNISSVIKSREQYEHKIQNMECVKEYYQEFIDTADYLLQNLNNHSVVMSNLKYEQLEQRNNGLHEEINILETKIYEQENELKKLEIDNETNKDIIKRQKIQIREQNRNQKMIKLLEEENEFLKSQLKKSNKNSSNVKKVKREWYSERKKLMDENITLKDTNEYLERKCQQLEDYCNHLLNRRSDELPVTNTVSENNIFKQLVEGN